MATSDSPLSVPNVTLAVARQSGGGDSWAAGAPTLSSVTGTFAQDASLVIAGSNISTNRNGQLYFNSFNNGTLGANALTDAGWRGDTDAYLVSDVNAPAGKTKSARLDADGISMPSAYYEFPQETKEVWMHCDMRLWGDQNKLTGTDGPQVKLWRIHSTLGDHASKAYAGYIYDNIDPGANGSLQCYSTGPFSPTPGLDHPGFPTVSGQWHRWTLAENVGTLNTKDGYSVFRSSFGSVADNSSQANYNDPDNLYPDKSWKLGKRIVLDGDEPKDIFSGIFMPFYHRSYQHTTVNLSNLWLNDSPEQVLFANAETFETADASSIVNQPMARRESGEIEVECQEGPNGELSTGPVYAFVFNKDGSYNETGLQVRAL